MHLIFMLLGKCLKGYYHANFKNIFADLKNFKRWYHMAYAFSSYMCVCVCVCIHTYIVKATHLEIIAADECSTLLILTAEYYLITLFIHFLRFIFCLRWIGQEECSCKEFIVKISEPEDKSYMQLCAWHQGFSWIWHQIPQVIRLTVWSTV